MQNSLLAGTNPIDKTVGGQDWNKLSFLTNKLEFRFFRFVIFTFFKVFKDFYVLTYKCRTQLYDPQAQRQVW